MFIFKFYFNGISYKKTERSLLVELIVRHEYYIYISSSTKLFHIINKVSKQNFKLFYTQAQSHSNTMILENHYREFFQIADCLSFRSATS